CSLTARAARRTIQPCHSAGWSLSYRTFPVVGEAPPGPSGHPANGESAVASTWSFARGYGAPKGRPIPKACRPLLEPIEARLLPGETFGVLFLSPLSLSPERDPLAPQAVGSAHPSFAGMAAGAAAAVPAAPASVPDNPVAHPAA